MPFDAYRKYIAQWYTRDIVNTDDESNFFCETSHFEETPFLRAAQVAFEHIELTKRYVTLQYERNRKQESERVLYVVPTCEDHRFAKVAQREVAPRPAQEVAETSFRTVLNRLKEIGPRSLEDSLQAHLSEPRDETKNLFLLHLHHASHYADPLLPAFTYFDRQFLHTPPHCLDVVVARNRHLQIIEYLVVAEKVGALISYEWAKYMHMAYAQRFNTLPSSHEVHLARFSVAHVLGDRKQASQELKALSSSPLFPKLVRIFNKKL